MDVHPNVSLFVVPASQQVRQQVQALDYPDSLESAGAQMLKPVSHPDFSDPCGFGDRQR